MTRSSRFGMLLTPALTLTFAITLLSAVLLPCFGIARAGGLDNTEGFDCSEYKDIGIYVVERHSGAVLIDNKSLERYAPASTTKLLTAAVMLDVFDPSEEITVTEEMLVLVEPGSSLAGLENGETLTVTQMIYAMMLPSGNEAARAVGVAVGRRILGDETAGARKAMDIFVAKMNEKAKIIGLVDSHFVNPDGFPKPGMYSTAKDITTLSLYVLSHYPLVDQAVKTSVVTVETNRGSHTWRNTNALLHEKLDYVYADGSELRYDARMTGAKTGNAGQNGGRCYTFSASQGNFEVVGSILHVTQASGKNIFLSAVDILDYIYSTYRVAKLPYEDEHSITVTITNSTLFVSRTITLSALDEGTFLLPAANEEKPIVRVRGEDGTVRLRGAGDGEDSIRLSLARRLAPGDVVLYKELYVGDEMVVSVQYAVTESVRKADFLDAVVVLPYVAMASFYAVKIVKRRRGLLRGNAGAAVLPSRD